MLYAKAQNFIAEHIGFLVACEGYTQEAAATEAFKHKALNELLEAVGKRKCKQVGHNYSDGGSYANGEGAAECLTCVRCGHTFKHIYF